MSPMKLLLSFVFVTAAYVVKGLAGFGDPLLYSPLLSLYLPNSTITPALAPVSLAMNAGIVWRSREHFSAKIVLPITVFVILGTIPGTLLLRVGSPQVLKLVLGLVIIGLGIEMLLRKPGTLQKPHPVARAVISFCSGLTAGLFGINLLFLAYMERVTENREEFRANSCFIFFLDNVFRLAMLIVTGMFTRDALLLCAVSLPAAFLGMRLGRLLDSTLSEKVSRRLIILVFILGGVSISLYALPQLL